MSETVKLTERQQEVVLSRLGVQMERILRSGLPEEKKLLAIGKKVAGDIADLTDPLYDISESPVAPSILPKHDDTTIDHLARWQRVMRKSNIPAAVQAETLDRFERLELQMQRDDRPPRRPSVFDGEPHVSYYFE